MMLPQEIACKITTNEVTLTLKLMPELFWFKGHFPAQAILPGVAQIDLVMHYAKTKLQIDLPFKGMDVVKFQRPLFPDETIELTVSWQPENQKLSFQYLVDGTPASSGRIALCR
jgi:3-hydroxymyristoyl/3-hydroxydecanoyl-(acyl carrier protein) dehydratase